MGQLIGALAGPVGHLMTMTGLQTSAMTIEGLCTLLQVALVLALLPAYGIEGAALGTAVASVLRSGIMFAVVRRNLGIRSTIL